MHLIGTLVVEECRGPNVPSNGEECVRDVEKAENAALNTR